MSLIVPLWRIAAARAGDKGDTSNISVVVRDPAHYPHVCAQLTADRIRDAYRDVFRGTCRRYRLDHLGALNFVCDRALEGGVSRSLNLDAHGKSFSYLILRLEIELPDQAKSPPSTG